MVKPYHTEFIEFTSHPIGECSASFPSSSSPLSWFIMFNRRRIQIISSLTYMELSSNDLFDMDYVNVVAVDEHVLFTTSGINQSLSVLEPFTGTITNLEIDLNEDAKHLAAVKDKQAKLVHFLSANSKVLQIGWISFQDEHALEEELTLSLDLQSIITASGIYLDKLKNSPIYVTGHSNGEVKLSTIENGNLICLSQKRSAGIVTDLVYHTNTYRDILVVVHDIEEDPAIPLVQIFIIDRQFNLNLIDSVKWPADYSKGQLLSIKVATDGDHYRIFTLYETTETETVFLDIFSTATNSRIYREPIQCNSGTGPVLDLEPSNESLSCQLIFQNGVSIYLALHDLQPKILDSANLIFSDWFGMNHSQFPYKNQMGKSIVEMRKLLNGELFIDKFLGIFGVDPKLYPPHDIGQLELLFNAINSNGEQPLVLKHCAIYYLLQDYNPRHAKHVNFAKFVSLSKPYLLAMNGFWDMDHDKPTEAIQFLTDPSVDLSDTANLDLDWSNKIISTLVERNHLDLALKFINCTQPTFWMTKSIETTLHLLCRLKTPLALEFQRRYSKAPIMDTFNLILNEGLTGTPESVREFLTHLASVRLLTDEEQCVVGYCRASDNILLKDFLLKFLIECGRYSEAYKSYRDMFDGVSSDSKSIARNSIMSNVFLMLPPIIQLSLKTQREIIVQNENETLQSLTKSTIDQKNTHPVERVLEAFQQSYQSIEPIVQTPSVPPQTTPLHDRNVKYPTSSSKESPLNSKHLISSNRSSPLNSNHLSSATKNSPIIKESPSSPFIQPPFVPRPPSMRRMSIENNISIRTSPHILESPIMPKSPSLFRNPETPTPSPRLAKEKLPLGIEKIDSKSPIVGLSSPYTSSNQRSPLVSKSPFAHHRGAPLESNPSKLASPRASSTKPNAIGSVKAIGILEYLINL
ncbi:nuclear pore complex assembly-domain-containing protein [Globomyces pollinis-pini]|nr:nuclear pore complex assembly-domain-containing protein [Globomyces pollinis-pini]